MNDKEEINYEDLFDIILIGIMVMIALSPWFIMLLF